MPWVSSAGSHLGCEREPKNIPDWAAVVPPPGLYFPGKTSYFLLIFKSFLNNLKVELRADLAFYGPSVILAMGGLKILIL